MVASILKWRLIDYFVPAASSFVCPKVPLLLVHSAFFYRVLRNSLSVNYTYFGSGAAVFLCYGAVFLFLLVRSAVFS